MNERSSASRRLSPEEFWDDVRANPDRSTPVFWDDFYTRHTTGEGGAVGRLLHAEVEALPPGTALDLGCGEGADALWLAERGWRVLGVDASAVAVARARAHADRIGMGERAVFEQHDLALSFPAGSFDLVSAQFLHSPVAVPGEREHVLGRAAAAVAPGGRVVVVSHAAAPSWATDVAGAFSLPTPAENLAALGLDPDDWVIERDALVAVDLPGPDGQPGTRQDHVLRARRTSPRT